MSDPQPFSFPNSDRQRRPRLLLSNDDGIHAQGLAALAEALVDYDVVGIAAPLENCSGRSQAISLHRTVRIREVPGSDGIPRVAVDGTPADAVKFAFRGWNLPAQPDLVITGINLGANVGRSVQYSGTLGAALEGLTQQVSALATSQESNGGLIGHGWQKAQELVREAVDLAIHWWSMQRDGDPLFCLSLNIPCLPEDQIHGIQVARLSTGGYDEYFAPIPGEPGCWQLKGEWILGPAGDSFDSYALRQGYATLTPIRYDRTADPLLAPLRATLAQRSCSH